MLAKQILIGKLATLTTRANYMECTRHGRIQIRNKIISEELFSWNLIVE